LQWQGHLLFAGEGAAVPEDGRADRRQPPQRHADPASGDFFCQLLDGESDFRGGVMGPWLQEVGGNTGKNITEVKYDLLFLEE
jgi:hypothetical protein